MLSVLLRNSTYLEQALGQGRVPGAGSREPENPSATLKPCSQLPIRKKLPAGVTEMLMVGHPKVSTLGVPGHRRRDSNW